MCCNHHFWSKNNIFATWWGFDPHIVFVTKKLCCTFSVSELLHNSHLGDGGQWLL